MTNFHEKKNHTHTKIGMNQGFNENKTRVELIISKKNTHKIPIWNAIAPHILKHPWMLYQAISIEMVNRFSLCHIEWINQSSWK